MNLKEDRFKTPYLHFFAPNFFTALNMFCGFLSINSSLQGRFTRAVLLIIMATILDLMDGRIARITHAQSAFGEQFDSFSDLISFGMAPAILLKQFFFPLFTIKATLLPFFFLLCGALRLARFNITNNMDRKYFQGVSIPVAALAISSLILLNKYLPLRLHTTAVSLYSLFYSLLMISTIPFYSFKYYPYKKALLLLSIIIIGSIFIYEQILVFAYINLYVIISLFIFFKKHRVINAFSWLREREQVGEENDE